MSTPYSTPRLTLFSTTFWEVLPSHYDKIITRWSKIAHLHHEAKSDILATDRAGAVASLKAELEMLDRDVERRIGIQAVLEHPWCVEVDEEGKEEGEGLVMKT